MKSSTSELGMKDNGYPMGRTVHLYNLAFPRSLNIMQFNIPITLTLAKE
jgi:hypothetical protein